MDVAQRFDGDTIECLVQIAILKASLLGRENFVRALPHIT